MESLDPIQQVTNFLKEASIKTNTSAEDSSLVLGGQDLKIDSKNLNNKELLAKDRKTESHQEEDSKSSENLSENILGSHLDLLV